MNQILSARKYIMRNNPFIASKLCTIPHEIDNSEENQTACTDGQKIYFNESFCDTLSFDQMVTLIAHELNHIIFCHHYRFNNRDGDLWNVACDYAINLLLVEMGFTPLDNWCYDEKYIGWRAEDIYNDLSSQDADSQEQQIEQSKMSGGEFKEPQNIDEETKEQEITKAKIDITNNVSNIQKVIKGIKQSDLPQKIKDKQLNNITKGLENIVEEIEEFTKSKIDWREILNQFIGQQAMSDYSFMNCDRRFASSGFCMPGLDNPQPANIILAIDVSSSLSQIANEVANEALACAKECNFSLTLIPVSDYIHDIIECENETDIKRWKGGGTCFISFFEEMQKIENKTCIIFLTDGMVVNIDKWKNPNIPVCWMLTKQNRYFSERVEFGEIFTINY